MKDLLRKINNGIKFKDSKLICSNLSEYFILNKGNNIFFKHPLGFNFLNLGNVSSKEQLRVHVWNQNNHKQNENLQIHNHSFSFESYVLFGEIKNKLYKIINTLEPNSYLYEVKFIENISYMVLSNCNVDIQEKSIEIIEREKFYYVNKKEFHESININNLTITVIRMIKPKQFNFPLVFSPFKIDKNISFKREPLCKSDNSKISNLIIEKCMKNLML